MLIALPCTCFSLSILSFRRPVDGWVSEIDALLNTPSTTEHGLATIYTTPLSDFLRAALPVWSREYCRIALFAHVCCLLWLSCMVCFVCLVQRPVPGPHSVLEPEAPAESETRISNLLLKEFTLSRDILSHMWLWTTKEYVQWPTELFKIHQLQLCSNGEEIKPNLTFM